MNLDLSFKTKQSPSSIWVIPLSNDKKNYFTAMKQPVATEGKYMLNNKNYECKDNECLMMVDNGRGHFNYGVAYFWVLIMTKTADGRPVFINLSDGIGSEFKSLDKASEDFIVIGDQFYKFDVTALEYYKDDYFTKKRVYTPEGD